MVDDIAIYVGLDVSKEKIAVGLAEAGRKGEVSYYGEMPTVLMRCGSWPGSWRGVTGACAFVMKRVRRAMDYIASFPVSAMNASWLRHRWFQPVRDFR